MSFPAALERRSKDHLGNGRVYCYHNAALNQAKTIQETHYYAFGLPIQKLNPNFEAPLGVEANNYQYNGIELVEDFGLHINHAQFRSLDPQTGRWWQIDPMAEKFYAWSPYNSNLNNPIRHEDPKGDCVNCLIGGVVGAAVEYGFQVATNYYNGKRGMEMVTPELGKIFVSAGAGFLTSGFSTVTQIESKLVVMGVNQIESKITAFSAHRLVDGAVGAGESVIKQYIDVQKGKTEAISSSEVISDTFFSTVTGGWGEGAEIAAKSYLQKEFSNATQAVISVGAEVQENSYQRITTATINEINTPKNQHMASPTTPSTQPTQKPATMPASGNRMANPQPILQFYNL